MRMAAPGRSSARPTRRRCDSFSGVVAALVLALAVVVAQIVGSGAASSGLDAPVLTSTPRATNTVTLAPAFSFTFTCVATGRPTPTVSFYRNNRLLAARSTVGTATLLVSGTALTMVPTLTSLVVSDDLVHQLTGWYSCLAASSMGSARRDFNVVVRTMPEIKVGPTDQIVDFYSAGYGLMHCAVTGVPAPAVTWIKDNKTVSTASGQRFIASSVGINHYLTITQLTLSDAGQYSCVATNDAVNLVASARSGRLTLLTRSYSVLLFTDPGNSTTATSTLKSVLPLSFGGTSSLSKGETSIFVNGLQYNASTPKYIYTFVQQLRLFSLEIRNLQESDSGIYSVFTEATFISPSAGVNQTVSKKVAVLGPPSLVTSAQSITVVIGEQRVVSIFCAGNSKQLGTIEWQARLDSGPWRTPGTQLFNILPVTNLGSMAYVTLTVDSFSSHAFVEVECRLVDAIGDQETAWQRSSVTILASCTVTENWLLNGIPTHGDQIWAKSTAALHPSEGLSIQTDSATGEALFTNTHIANSSRSFSWYQDVKIPNGATSYSIRVLSRATSSTAREHYPVIRATSLTAGGQTSNASTIILYTGGVAWQYVHGNHSLTSNIATIRVFLGTFNSGRWMDANTALYKRACLQFVAPNAKPTLTGTLAHSYVRPIGGTLTLRCPAIGFPRPIVSWTSLISSELLPDGSLSIASITATHFNVTLTCTARNSVGQANQSTVITQEIGAWGMWSISSCSTAASSIPLAGTACMYARTRLCIPVGNFCYGNGTEILNCCQAPTTATIVPTTAPPTTPGTTRALPPTTPRPGPPTTPRPGPPTTPRPGPPTTPRPGPPTAPPTTAPASIPTMAALPSTVMATTAMPTTGGNLDESKAPNSSTLYIGIGAGAGVLILLILIVIIACSRRRSRGKKSLSSTALYSATDGDVTLETKARKQDSSPRYASDPGNRRGLTSQDSMIQNPKYVSAANPGAQPMYNEIPTTSVKYVPRQQSGDSYVDMNHSAAQYDRPSPVLEQNPRTSASALHQHPPGQQRSNHLAVGTAGSQQRPAYDYARADDPATIHPVSLNTGTIATDSATYEVTGSATYEVADGESQPQRTTIHPVGLNPTTIATDSATYEVTNSGLQPQHTAIHPVRLNPSTITTDSAMYDVTNSGQQSQRNTSTTNHYEVNE